MLERRSFFDLDVSDNTTPEVRLWQAVLSRAIDDAFGVWRGDVAWRDLERQRARSWLSLSNPDFIEVCNHAAVHPAAAFAHVQRLTEEAGDQ